MDGVADAQPLGVGLEAVAQDPVANEDEPNARVRGEDGGGRGEDVVVPLPLKEAGHRGEGDLVGLQAQLAADLVPRPGRIQEGVDVHPAIDRRILLRPTDPGGERLLGHGVADADDRMAPPRRPPLQGDVHPVLEGRFARTKGQAVDRVDHGGDPLVPPRGAADDSRLRRVRMDHLGLEPTDRPPECSISRQVGPGPDRADQLGHHLDFQPPRRRPREQVPLRPFRRPGDQGHVVAVVVVQSINGQ